MPISAEELAPQLLARRRLDRAVLNQILRQSAQEEHHLLFRHYRRNRIVQIVLMAVILRVVVAAALALATAVGVAYLPSLAGEVLDERTATDATRAGEHVSF